MRIFKGFLGESSLKRRFGTAVPTCFDNLKARQRRAFCMHYQLWLPPQTRTQRTFREKSFGISKAFAKINWCGRCEILWLTFLIRKVSDFDRINLSVCRKNEFSCFFYSCVDKHFWAKVFFLVLCS